MDLLDFTSHTPEIPELSLCFDQVVLCVAR